MKRACTFSSGNIVVCLCIAVVFFLFAHQAGAQEENDIYDVDILWSTNTTIPSLYEGKALFVRGAEIKALALIYNISTGEVVDPNQLMFTWKFNNQTVGASSGVGKFAYTLRPLAEDFDISVEVRNGNTTLATAITTIQATSPHLTFYERRPLLGTILERSLEKQVAFYNTLGIVAEPYYFLPSFINYRWFKNNNEFASNGSNSINFESTENSTMTHIRVKAEPTTPSLHTGEAEISVIPLQR